MSSGNQGTVHRERPALACEGLVRRDHQRGWITSTDLDQASAQAPTSTEPGRQEALAHSWSDSMTPISPMPTSRRFDPESKMDSSETSRSFQRPYEFKIEVLDVEEDRLQSNLVEPSQTYTELCAAIKKYDSGDIDEKLEKEGDVVTRDIKIPIPARKKEPRHEGFEHTAKLVVTLSDHEADDLENQVCLFRGPEMLVETISDEIPDQKFHAFLAAGRAVAAESTEPALRHADDYLAG